MPESNIDSRVVSHPSKPGVFYFFFLFSDVIYLTVNVIIDRLNFVVFFFSYNKQRLALLLKKTISRVFPFTKTVWVFQINVKVGWPCCLPI